MHNITRNKILSFADPMTRSPVHVRMAANYFSFGDNPRISKWICRIAVLFGYWPFGTDEIAESQANRITLYIRNWLWPVFAMVIYVASMCGQWFTSYLTTRMGYKWIEILIETLTNMGYTLVSILAVLTSIKNRHEFTEFMRITKTVDQEVRHPQSTIQCRILEKYLGF